MCICEDLINPHMFIKHPLEMVGVAIGGGIKRNRILSSLNAFEFKGLHGQSVNTCTNPISYHVGEL